MTGSLPTHERQRVAALTRSLYEGLVTVEDYIESLEDLDDPLLNELTSLLARDPEVGGTDGVSPADYRAYRARVNEIIAKILTWSD